MNKGAIISQDGRYRYQLSRVWDVDRPLVGWIMLNPSTADAKEDDSTITRCIGFSKGFGFGGMYIVNLFALRSKDRHVIKEHGFTSIGISNDRMILEYMKDCKTIIAAWGNDGQYLNRDKDVIKMFDNIKCLTITIKNCPGHPLYLKSSLKLIDFKCQGAI